MQLWRSARQYWRISGDLTESLAETEFRRRPGKWLMHVIRAVVIVFGLLIGPWFILARTFRLRRESGFEVLRRHAGELWDESPFDALALVRGTYETFHTRGGFAVWMAGGSVALWASIEIPPFGKFSIVDLVKIYGLLYELEFALGRYEEAMDVWTSYPNPGARNVLKQVDCMMAMGRRDDAIAHIEKNLNLDTWRGPLRRRLEELSGKPGGGVN